MKRLFDLIPTIVGEWETVAFIDFTNEEILSVKSVTMNYSANRAEIHLLSGGVKQISLDKSLLINPHIPTIDDLSLYQVKVLCNGVDTTYRLVHK